MTFFNETRSAAALLRRRSCTRAGLRFLTILCLPVLASLLSSGCSGTAAPEEQAAAPAEQAAGTAAAPQEGTAASGSTVEDKGDKDIFRSQYFDFTVPAGWEVVSFSDKPPASISVQSRDLSTTLTLQEFNGSQYTDFLCSLEEKGMKAIGGNVEKKGSAGGSGDRQCAVLAEIDGAAAGYFSVPADHGRYFVIRYRGDFDNKVKQMLESLQHSLKQRDSSGRPIPYYSSLNSLIKLAGTYTPPKAAAAEAGAEITHEPEPGTENTPEPESGTDYHEEP